jgi:hypothetical protein
MILTQMNQAILLVMYERACPMSKRALWKAVQPLLGLSEAAFEQRKSRIVEKKHRGAPIESVLLLPVGTELDDDVLMDIKEAPR